MVIIGIINVGIITIIERKLLSRIQRRKGPIRIITQGIKDGIKGIRKERIKKEDSKYYIGVFLSLIITIIIWEVLPVNINYKEINWKYDIIIYIIAAGINIYPIIYTGISSENKYSMIGIIRGINQVISYEINITIGIIGIIIINKTYNIGEIIIKEIEKENIYMILIMVIIFISLLAESNRTPFDLIEGESELVGGRVTEYSSIEFLIIYIVEYWIILLNSYLFLILSLGSTLNSPFLIFFIIIYIKSRAVLPRYTYNNIIKINWRELIPIMFSFVIFYYLLAG